LFTCERENCEGSEEKEVKPELSREETGAHRRRKKSTPEKIKARRSKSPLKNVFNWRCPRFNK